MVFKGTSYEREFCKYAESKGFHAERIAGSGARERSVCDVVLIKNGKGYLVEVKSTKDKVFYLSDKPGVKERIREMIKVARSCKAVPLIAVRFKGKEKKWVVRKLSFKTKKVSVKDKSIF